MAKFKYIKKKGGSFEVTPVPGEQLNYNEVNAAGSMSCRPIFLCPHIDRSGVIIYSFRNENCMILSRFLRRPINRAQFYMMIAQLLEAYKIAAEGGADPSKICLDPDCMTICPDNGFMGLVYQPFENLQSPNMGLMRCLGQICSMLKFASPQDQAGINEFIAFASRLRGFPIRDIDNFIRNTAPLTYNFIGENLNPYTGMPAPPHTPAVPADNTFEDQKTVIRHTAPPEVPVAAVKKSAVLVRRSSGEEIVIDKEQFIIGKERAKVDYCVTGNRTVSRVHAMIFRRDDGFYIQDNNSTNRTFINGTPIQPMTEIKINVGDEIRLSDENFVLTEK